MAWTQTELDALNAAIANGAMTVRYADRSVQYRTISEMLQIRSMMMDELGLPSVVKDQMRKFSYSKGIT